MIGQNGHRHGLVPAGYLIENRLHDTRVEVLDRPDLQLGIALVSGLVARLDMQKNEIVRAQRIERGPCLAFVIGRIQPGRPLDVDRLQAGINADTLDQVDGRNHDSVTDAVTLHQRFHPRTVTRRPGPNAVGRFLAGRHSGPVDRMILQ